MTPPPNLTSFLTKRTYQKLISSSTSSFTSSFIKRLYSVQKRRISLHFVPSYISCNHGRIVQSNQIGSIGMIDTVQGQLSSFQSRMFGRCLTLFRRGVYHPFVQKKRRTVAGVRKRFKVTGSGKLMRRGIGNRHLAWRKQSRRKRRMKHKKWVEVENKTYAKKITSYLGKRNYI